MKISDVVFTNHSIERMKERGISGEWALQAVKNPKTTSPGKEKHTTEFINEINGHTLTVIGKKNDLGEWVVLSTWMDPPLTGTKDYYKREKYIQKINKDKEFDKKMEKASFFGKLLLTFRKQIGF